MYLLILVQRRKILLPSKATQDVVYYTEKIKKNTMQSKVCLKLSYARKKSKITEFINDIFINSISYDWQLLTNCLHRH